MRHSYGIIDRRKVLVYKPQLFQRTDDLLIFPSKDFQKWHSEILEYIDGLIQLNIQCECNNEDLKLAIGILLNIDIELQNLFDPDKKMDYSYYYISQIDKNYKKRNPQLYERSMYHVDRNVLKITPQVKHRHQMEILKYAHWLWAQKDKPEILKVKKK